MNDQVNYAKIQRIQDNLEALTIGTFGTGFVTDAMMYESGIKATVAQHTSDLDSMVNINLKNYSTLRVPTVDTYDVNVSSLQSAINNGKIRITVPTGKFVFNAKLTLHPNTVIDGNGANVFFDTESVNARGSAVITTETNGLTAIFEMVGGEGYFFRNICIDGNNNATSAINSSNNTKVIIIENCLVIHCVSDGIKINQGQIVQIDKLVAKYNNGYGLYLTNTNDSNIDNTFITCNTGGIYMDVCGTWNISNTKFEWNRGHGLYHTGVGNSDSNKFVNCTFHQNNKTGVYAGSMSGWGFNNCYFNGNGNAMTGVDAEQNHIYCGGGWFTFVGNDLQLGLQNEGAGGETGTVPAVGIRLTGTFNNVQLIGNKTNNSANTVYNFTGATLKNSTICFDNNIKTYDNNGNLLFDTTDTIKKPNKCTSSTRPSGLGANDSGLMYYETDTDCYIKWDGTAWRQDDLKVGIGALPTASANYRGKHMIVFGAGADVEYVCVWTGSAYTWKTVTLT